MYTISSTNSKEVSMYKLIYKNTIESCMANATYLNTEIKQNIFKDNQFGKFKIKSLWFTIQKINQGHSKHNHPKSALSGVYYHQIDKNSGGSIEVFLEKEKIEYSPKKNDLIIFNSDTYHSVKPYNGINDRIAIAWDAIYTL